MGRRKRPAMPGAGRPSLGDAALRKVITLKVTEADHTRFTNAAEAESLTLSDWMRAAAELAYARGSTR